MFSSFSVAVRHFSYFLFFFNDTATTQIYTLSLHDALPISSSGFDVQTLSAQQADRVFHGQCLRADPGGLRRFRSEEHTSELQSRRDLVCRLLLEKKKRKPMTGSMRRRYVAVALQSSNDYFP